MISSFVNNKSLLFYNCSNCLINCQHGYYLHKFNYCIVTLIFCQSIPFSLNSVTIITILRYAKVFKLADRSQNNTFDCLLSENNDKHFIETKIRYI